MQGSTRTCWTHDHHGCIFVLAGTLHAYDGACVSCPRLTWQPTGAQVLTSEAGGSPLLYCSPLHDPSVGQPARGGIPVLFPQFADRGPHRKHGWARDVEWNLLDEQITDDAHCVLWENDFHQHPGSDWPHSAVLALSAKVSAGSLSLELQITNTGPNAFRWTGGLHPYWAVSDVRECAITGLKSAVVQDRFKPARAVETGAPLRITNEPFESLYDTPAPLILTSDDRKLRLSMTGFDQWMVWNPGEIEARHMADLPDGGWQSFVCIEPVLVTRPHLLKPGETFKGSLHANWVV